MIDGALARFSDNLDVAIEVVDSGKIPNALAAHSKIGIHQIRAAGHQNGQSSAAVDNQILRMHAVIIVRREKSLLIEDTKIDLLMV